MIGKCMIVTMKKEGYRNVIGTKTEEFTCSDCKEPVLVEAMTLKQGREDAKEQKKELDYLCMDCYKKMPRFGKIIRPNQERIERMREEGYEIDEVMIRKTLKAFRNKEF